MRSRFKDMARLGAAWACAAVVLQGTPAHASAKAECIATYEHAQKFKQEGRLSDAKQQLLLCMRDICPDMLKKDCDEWLKEVDRAMPSVVIIAKGSEGRELTDVQVTLDGKVVAEHLDGKGISMDPGNHDFHFVHGDMPPIDEKVLVREGEKNRPLTITFSSSTSKQPQAPAGPVDEPAHSIPTGAYVLGGVGILALGSFGYFGLSGRSDVNDMQTCKPHCQQSDVDRARTKLIVADVSLGVGVVALGIATYLYLSAPSGSPEKPADTALRFDLAPLKNGGYAGLSARF